MADVSEQEAESECSLDVGSELPQQASDSQLEALTVCEERDPKGRRELLMAECRKWWHALLDKDKWIRDQDQGLVNKVVGAIQRRFPELTVPAIRAIIARSMRKAREKTKNASSKTELGPQQEAGLKLPADGSPPVELLRSTKLPQMSESATTSSEEETISNSEQGCGMKRKLEDKVSSKVAHVKSESLEKRRQSPGPSGKIELQRGGLPTHLRLPYEIPPAPRFKGGPSLTACLNLPTPSDLQLHSWVAPKPGGDNLLASLNAPSNYPLASTSSLAGTSSRSRDEAKQRLIALELRVRTQEAQIAQYQAKETSWQAEKLSFEWHIQKLEQAEMCARESAVQVKAHAENLKRELHIRTLANNELEHQIRSLLSFMRGSVYERPHTPQFGDLSPSDQQKLLPALLLAYQKMNQGGHVSTAHMAQPEGEKQTSA